MENPHSQIESSVEQLIKEASELLGVIKNTTPIVRDLKESLVGKKLTAERSAKIQGQYNDGLKIIDDAYHALAALFENPKLNRASEAGCTFVSLNGQILINIGTLPFGLRMEFLLKDGTLFEHEEALGSRSNRIVPVSLAEFARCIRICTEYSALEDED